MAYFPLFVDLKGKRCLVVGGKRVALRKARALAEYGGGGFSVAEGVCEGGGGGEGRRRRKEKLHISEYLRTLLL